jgi:transcriptional regulator with XRE-family HTH domain
MPSLGETLRRARQAQGLDLCTVAAQTKISAKYLEAIESDNRKILPSGFFYRSFVEQYAKSLSLDTQEIDAEVDRVLSADEPLPLPGFESVVARNVPPITSAYRFHTKRSYASAVALVLVLVGCSGVYALWRSGRSPVGWNEMVGHVRALVKTAPAQSARVQPKRVVARTPVQRPAVRPMAQTNAVPEVNAVSVSLPSDANQSEYKVMLDLLAHESTWLSVSSDGKPVFSGTLHPNETKSVGGKEFAKLRVGNAAGLEVRLNGKLLGPLGARGQVLIVLFTPDNFQIFSPPKESD